MPSISPTSLSRTLGSFLAAFFLVTAAAEAQVELMDSGLDGYIQAPEASPSLPANSEPAVPPQAQLRNKRLQTLDGSKSPWSGQFNLSYTGSTLSHPLSEEAPNPGHMVPAPLVTLSGTFSTRYRYSKDMTMGVGTGLTTQTPLQGPKKTSLADPYADVARSYTLFGSFHSRVDLSFTNYTNHQQYNELGYRQNISLTNEALYEFESGVSIGLSVIADKNFFASGRYPLSQQKEYDFAFDPVLEYAINSTLNLRSVVGVIDNHNKMLGSSYWRYQHPAVYQTAGLGIAAADSVFFYVYAKALPYSSEPVTSSNTTCGVSMIINLF